MHILDISLFSYLDVDNSGSSLISLDFTYNVVFPNRESNPGRGGESAESYPLDHQGAVALNNNVTLRKLVFNS